MFVGSIVLANENAPSHKTNTSRNCRHKASNIGVQQRAVWPLPPLKYCQKSIEYMAGIVHYLFYILTIQTPPMVSAKFNPNFFLDTEYFCLNAALFFHFQCPHCFQFELVIRHHTSSLHQLVNKLFIVELLQRSQNILFCLGVGGGGWSNGNNDSGIFVCRDFLSCEKGTQLDVAFEFFM